MDRTLARRPVGQLLDGRYRVESHVADGGMATIYLGTDVRLDRTVALKVMRAEFASDEDFVRRFVTEARAVARLSHPNVVTVYDQGADGQSLYLAMEYVAGRNLRALLRERGRLSPDEALDIMDGVLAGLAAAHEAGLAHRDVKPENVLLTDSGQVKVADFGLARLLAAASHTKSGMIIGTAAYLAPEQVSGGMADARTDVYAAGVMLFELLTGYQPHTGETPLAVAYKHVNAVVPPPSSVVPGLPPAVDALVAMATSRDPDLRPGDAGQFLRAIVGVRHSLPPGALSGQDAAGRGPAGSQLAPGPGRSRPGPGQPRLGEPSGGPAATTLPPVGYVGAGTGADTPQAGLVIPPPWRQGPPQGYPGRGLAAGMAPAAPGQPGGREGHQPTQQFGPNEYRPGSNKTLIVGGAVGPSYGYGPPSRRYGRSDEPRLQRMLFSRKLGYLALGLVAVVIIAVGGWWQLAGRFTAVPRVAGLTVAAARSELQGLGFTTATSKPQINNNVPKGRVISTTPGAGTKLAKGGQVTLLVSAGPRMIVMPQVTGQPLASAQAAIRQAGLTPGKVKGETSATIPAGIVLATRPAAGTSWPQPDPVVIVVSAGPPVPNFVGQPKDTAEAWANANGVALNEVSDANSTAPPGTIIHQSVPPGSAFTAHEVITITISAPDLVAVPNVDGLSQKEATHVLQQLGFKVQVVQQGPFHVVVNYSPTGQAPQGSTITIYVGL